MPITSSRKCSSGPKPATSPTSSLKMTLVARCLHALPPPGPPLANPGSALDGPEHSVNLAWRRVIVNAGVVNAWQPCLPRAVFRVFFHVLGRIVRFKNPFKYICSSQINHDTVHFTARRGGHQRQYYPQYQWHNRSLSLPKGALPTMTP